MGEHKIPAAHVPDDVMARVAARRPGTALEVARLAKLLGHGKETENDIRQLGRLLFELGEVREAEYLLRRNFEEGDATYGLYRRLFGKLKDEELATAIRGFSAQFNVELEFLESRDFLQRAYHIKATADGAHDFGFSATMVEFNYSHQEELEADVGSDGLEYGIFRWRSGKWVKQANDT